MGTLELYGHAIRRMRPHLGRLAIAIAGVLMASATEVLKPWPLKIVIDNVLRGAPLVSKWIPPMPRAELLIAACISLVILYAMLGLLNVMTNYVTISIGQRMVNELRAMPVRPPAAPLALISSPARSRRPDGAHHVRHLLDSNDRDERLLPGAVVADSARRDVRRHDQDGRDADARRARHNPAPDSVDHVDQRAHRRDRRRRANQGEPPIHRRAERARRDSRGAGLHPRRRVVPRVRRVEQREPRRHAAPVHSANAVRRRGRRVDRVRHRNRDLPRRAARPRRPPHASARSSSSQLTWPRSTRR